MNNVSVCMTSYNGGLYIKSQIDSILSQLSNNDELIIADDGSEDNTIKIIKNYNDKRIKLHINNFKNHVANFEFALMQATGKYIFLSDQDDVWMENKITICLEYLKNYDLVCSNCIVVDANMQIIQESFYKNPTNARSGLLRNLVHNNYLGCCMAFNRKIIRYSLPFPNKLITHDTWIGLVSEIVGKPIFIDNKLIYFRRHANNTSNTLKKSNLRFLKKISYRFTIIKGLLNNILLRKNVQK